MEGRIIMRPIVPAQIVTGEQNFPVLVENFQEGTPFVTMYPMINFQKYLYRNFGDALAGYGMVSSGDRVLVCLSGGKDSTAMLELFHRWSGRSPIKVILQAIHVDFWGGAACIDGIREHADRLGVPLHIISGGDDVRKRILESPGFSPCYVCARERRIRIFQAAEKLGATKIALGHNLGDCLETVILNLLYGGSFGALEAVQPFFGGSLTVIRPMLLIEPSVVEEFVAAKRLIVYDNPCPVRMETKREKVRNMLSDLGVGGKSTLGSFRSALKKQLRGQQRV